MPPIPETLIPIEDSIANHTPGTPGAGHVPVFQTAGSRETNSTPPVNLDATGVGALLVTRVPVVLTPGANVTPNFGAGANFTLTLDQNTTLANPTGQAAGQFGYIRIVQDATPRTLSFGASWKFAGGPPSISTAAGAVDVIAYDVVAPGVIQAALIKDFR